jgi:hypothetical protein
MSINLREDLAVLPESAMCISADVWTSGVDDRAASLLGGTSNHGDHDIHDQALYPYIHQSASARS